MATVAMSKTAKNLYLDPDIIERAEEFGRRRGTSLSTLVNEYLDSLTRRLIDQEHGPIVRRLLGAGAPRAKSVKERRKKPGIEDYRRHLDKKYGHK
jgi:hypothetical protein